MEKEISLIWQTRTNNSIAKIYQYIAKNDPHNAEAFILRMYDFGLSLTILPKKFVPCRFEKFAHRGYLCAVFEKNFIFLFRIKGNIIPKVMFCIGYHVIF